MTPIKRILAVSLGAALATTTLSGSGPSSDEQRTRRGGQEGELVVEHPGGRLGGSATDEAKKPYTDYLIRIRNVTSTQPVWSVPLAPDGKFFLSGLPLPDKYLVELHLKTRPDNNVETRLVCTEGPFELKPPGEREHFTDEKLDINIECGQSAAWLWLAALAGGSNSIAGVLASGNAVSPGQSPPAEQSASR